MKSLEHVQQKTPDRTKETYYVNPATQRLKNLATACVMALTVITTLNVADYWRIRDKKEKAEKEIITRDPKQLYARIQTLYGDEFKRNLMASDGKAAREFMNFTEASEILKEAQEEMTEFDWGEFPQTVKNRMVVFRDAENNIQDNEEFKQVDKVPFSGRWTGEGRQMDSAFVVNLLEKTFPKGWGRTEVPVISYKDRRKKIPEQYAMQEQGDDVWAQYNTVEKTITFFKPAASYMLYDNINDCLAHELGHANDWAADNETSLTDKMELLLAVSDRIKAEDRFQSWYVEHIGKKEGVQEDQEIRYAKVSEYWAEICAAYFKDPATLNVKDFELVDNWVKKSDPDFDVFEASHLRKTLVFDYDSAKK